MPQRINDVEECAYPTRTLLLDEADEQRWAREFARFPEVRVTAEDFTAADRWLEKELATPRGRRACAEWCGGLLKMKPSVLLSLSEARRPATFTRLRARAVATSRRTAFMAAEASARFVGLRVEPLPFEAAAFYWLLFFELDQLLPGPRIFVDARGNLAEALKGGEDKAGMRIPVGLRVEADEWRELLKSHRCDREAAQWRSSWPEFAPPPPPPPLAGIEKSALWLKDFAKELVPVFEEAEKLAREDLARKGKPKARSADRARSAAERLLYRVLEANPSTQGRFRLKHLFDFHFEGRPAKADFAVPDIRLALDFDGYHRLENQDASPRDQRKAERIRQHGWVFFRIRAEEVMCDLRLLTKIIERILVIRGREFRIIASP